eukprot:COSAG02_NODE_744_length_17752_cov_56.794992_2_plen_62_part_00
MRHLPQASSSHCTHPSVAAGRVAALFPKTQACVLWHCLSELSLVHQRHAMPCVCRKICTTI